MQRFVENGNRDKLAIRMIPRVIFMRFMADYERLHPRPTPPYKTVDIAGVLDKEANYNDALYLQAESSWTMRYSQALFKFVIVHGIVDNPPEDWRSVFIDATEWQQLDNDEKKYLWVGELFPGDEDLQHLQEMVLSQNTVTEKALNDAEKN